MQEVHTINLFEDIGDWGSRLTDIVYDLQYNAPNGVQSIDIAINNYGGSVNEGIAIYNYLKGREENVVTRIVGFGMSMATIVLMAGDSRLMPEDSYLMIHKPMATGFGEDKDLEKASQQLAMLTTMMVNIYSSNTGLSEDIILQMMEDETWLPAQEALDLGFVTKLTKGALFEAKFKLSSIEGLAKVPEKIIEMSLKKDNQTKAMALFQKAVALLNPTDNAGGDDLAQLKAIASGQQTEQAQEEVIEEGGDPTMAQVAELLGQVVTKLDALGKAQEQNETSIQKVSGILAKALKGELEIQGSGSTSTAQGSLQAFNSRVKKGAVRRPGMPPSNKK